MTALKNEGWEGNENGCIYNGMVNGEVSSRMNEMQQMPHLLAIHISVGKHEGLVVFIELLPADVAHQP